MSAVATKLPQAESLTKPATSKEESLPGIINADTYMTLHTITAVILYNGRKAKVDSNGKHIPPIFGLNDFGLRCSRIHTQAKHDNPWADWYLYTIETTALKVLDEIEAARTKYKALFERRSRIRVGNPVSSNPVEYSLTYKTPWGFLGASVLSELDGLVLLILLARDQGVHDRDECLRELAYFKRRARHLFSVPFHFRFIKERNSNTPVRITRADVVQSTPGSVKAAKVMGDLPAHFLEAATRAARAPDIVPAIIFSDDGTDDLFGELH